MRAAVILGILVLCVSASVAPAIACQTQELWENVRWCNNGDGKDGVQKEGGVRLRDDGVGTRSPGQVLVGYMQCQHHQVPVGWLQGQLQGAFGFTAVEIGAFHGIANRLNSARDEGGKLLSNIWKLLGSRRGKDGRPFAILQECSLGELYKQAWLAVHSEQWDGYDDPAVPPANRRPRDVYGIVNLSCADFMSSDRGPIGWSASDISDSCHPILSDYWLKKYGG